MTDHDMEYMERLDVVVADAVGLIREKTSTYGDSWKRRGGPGAWFTTVRPWDRLEGILTKFGGDIFAAIALHPGGEDGTALACVRDVMNYCILIEAHARARLGVGPHGPARKSPEERWDEMTESRLEADRAELEVSLRSPPHRPGTPEDGGHHALEPAGEVTEDTAGAGGDGGTLRSLPGPERLEAFERAVRLLGILFGVGVSCTGGDDGLVQTVRVRLLD